MLSSTFLIKIIIFAKVKKNYTIKDIANFAGVSKGTVDRVLHKRGKVSKTALDKVNAVLSEINYQPNLIARNLKNTKVYKICVLLPNPEIDPYWIPCIDGIKEALTDFSSYNVDVLPYFFDPSNISSFLEMNQEIVESSPDAVLLVPLFHKESINIIENYKSLGIISSIFNNRSPSGSINNFVGQDLYQSGRLGAKLLNLLLKDGSIAIIHIDEVYENSVFIQEKEKGFRNYYLEKKNSKFNIITCHLQNATLKNTLKAFLKEHSDLRGIFVTTSKSYQIAEITSKFKDANIEIVGYDLLESNIKFLNNNDISFLIHQNPKRQVYIGVTSLIEHFIFGKEILNERLLPIDIITSENLKNYIE